MPISLTACESVLLLEVHVDRIAGNRQENTQVLSCSTKYYLIKSYPQSAMPPKEILVRRLQHIVEIAEASEDYDEALRNIRANGFPVHIWDDEIAYRLRQYDDMANRLRELNHKVNVLLERPVQSCHMNSKEGREALQFIAEVGINARTEAIEYLRDNFAGAKHLTICDPYFLLSSKISKADYLASIDSVIPTTVKLIELFVKPRKRDAEVATGFTKLCQDRNIKLICRKTDELHDRVWIVDSTRAFVVGASFNGLGNKFAFILPLPNEDQRKFIMEIGALRERTTRSKSA